MELISNRQVINAVTGVLYEMHPYHDPEGINVIIDKIEEYFSEKSEMSDRFKLVYFTDFKEFETELSNLLLSIPEFNAYNISRELKDKGVTDKDDPANAGMVFSSRDSAEISRYKDFIDLDACIRNIVHQIDIKQQDGRRLFLM